MKKLSIIYSIVCCTLPQNLVKGRKDEFAETDNKIDRFTRGVAWS